jgi:hypothetical protein
VNKIKFIFCGDMCGTKNTSQSASIEDGRRAAGKASQRSAKNYF